MSDKTLPCGICGESLTKENAVEHMQEEHDFPGDKVEWIE